MSLKDHHWVKDVCKVVKDVHRSTTFFIVLRDHCLEKMSTVDHLLVKYVKVVKEVHEVHYLLNVQGDNYIAKMSCVFYY